MGTQWLLDWWKQSLADCLEAQKRETFRGAFEVREQRIANFRCWIAELEGRAVRTEQRYIKCL